MKTERKLTVQKNENEENVIAYRLGRVEQLVDVKFKEMNQKLDNMVANFVTKSELKDSKDLAHKEHQSIREDIAEVRAEVAEVKHWKDSIVNRIAISAVTGLVLMVLAIYGLDKIFK